MKKINLEIQVKEVEEIKELLNNHKCLIEQLYENLDEIEKKVLEVNIKFNGAVN